MREREKRTGAVWKEGKHGRYDLPGFQGMRDGQFAERRAVRFLQLFDFASARSCVEIVVENDVLDRGERAKQRILRFVEAFRGLNGRRLRNEWMERKQNVFGL